MRTITRLTSILAAAALAACGSPPPPPPAPTPMRAVGMDEIRNDMAVFASDSFGGREVGTPYIRKASAFLTKRLMELGLEPAGDSMYYQRVPLYRTVYQPTTSFTVATGQTSLPLMLGPDLLPVLNLGPGAPLPRHNAIGDVYFAGYGMDTLGRRDFAKLDAPGRVIVIIHGAPAS